MHRKLLLPITLATVLFSGWVMQQSGWFAGRCCTAPRHPQNMNPQVISAQAILRYQQAQPRHWRYLILQR